MRSLNAPRLRSGHTAFDARHSMIGQVAIKGARVMECYVKVQLRTGTVLTVTQWKGDGEPGPVHILVPPLDYDRLEILLRLVSDEDNGAVELDVELQQDRAVLPGSRMRHAMPVAGRVLDLTLFYELTPAGFRPSYEYSSPQYGRTAPAAHAPRAHGFEHPVKTMREEPGLTLYPTHHLPGHGDAEMDLSAAAAHTEAPARRINVWMAEREQAPALPLIRDEACTLCINVGRPVPASLTGDAGSAIPDADVPTAGLTTEWVLHSAGGELVPISEDVSVTGPAGTGGGAPAWVARFPLHIPREGESAVVRLRYVPRATEGVRLTLLVYARDPAHPVRAELYREVAVNLWVVTRPGPSRAGQSSLQVAHDALHAAPAHTNLRPAYDWTTPPHTLSVMVCGPGKAHVRGDPGGLEVDAFPDWHASPANADPGIGHLRAALERFRTHHEAYLNAFPAGDLEGRLARQDPGADFLGDGEPPGEDHEQAWRTVATSPELRALAVEGRGLYDVFFPEDFPELRGWIGRMEPGSRLDITCNEHASSSFIPHIPWGLMYRKEIPAPGEPIDPMGFLGLDLRLGYRSSKASPASKALGRKGEVNRAFLLYWGDHPDDPVAAEAKWQHDRWSRVPNGIVVPGPEDAGAPKPRLVRLLDHPAPPPVAVIYLYCETSGEATNPVLRFADDMEAANRLERTDWGTARLADGPLVFANACATAASESSSVHALQQRFMLRGARAYLGTESKVPIQLASRFAAVFFHYFDRTAAPEPMAAGEAVFQARRFLWRHYRNLGGLFYTYLNQYELYLADDQEVRGMGPAAEAR